ncbi:MAG: hypothetical protein HUK03_05110, partial [Bacteroidaceae bacterium]|nr:hypothetical protein [Bacteroidaceae bacterium]
MRVQSLLIALCLCLAAHADSDTEGGFLTGMLNNYLKGKTETKTNDSLPTQGKVKYGRKVTDYVTVPEFSGYVIGKYSYTSKEGVSPNNLFEIRLARFTVTGTVLRDFTYRVHFELKGGNPLRDAYLEWKHWPELAVRAGQFKRCFTFE